ncbi:hypothetical protein HOLleu_33830 [Holothuria leucospilota]|uniref:Death domain-containing protein n=1 Tax=Holothuria leucospilota TaxID=206669 RepID=A0A9Q1BGX6_HOLLE|nr:hypothetical protein HOLleu_33830 [Holothuria leucospilota]
MDILMVDKGLKAGTIKGGDGNLFSPYQVAVEGDVLGDGNEYVFTKRPMTHAYDYPAMLAEHVYDAPPPGTLKWTDVTDKELSILAGKFGSDWKAFARETLLLQQTEIQHIENNNRNDLKEQIFSAFVAWRRKQEELKIKAKLIELLKNSGYCDHDAWEFLQTTSASGHKGRRESSEYEEPSTSTYYNVSRSDGPTISKMESNRIYSRHMYDGTTLANQGTAGTPATTSRASQLSEPQSDQVQNENMRMSVAAIKQKWENHNSL